VELPVNALVIEQFHIILIQCQGLFSLKSYINTT
jgi:hypothetical protein